MFKIVATIIAAIVIALSAPAATLAQAPTRNITKVTGDVYRFQNNNHFALVVVTGSGVVVVDPINADAAT